MKYNIFLKYSWVGPKILSTTMGIREKYLSVSYAFNFWWLPINRILLKMFSLFLHNLYNIICKASDMTQWFCSNGVQKHCLPSYECGIKLQCHRVKCNATSNGNQIYMIKYHHELQYWLNAGELRQYACRRYSDTVEATKRVQQWRANFGVSCKGAALLAKFHRKFPMSEITKNQAVFKSTWQTCFTTFDMKSAWGTFSYSHKTPNCVKHSSHSTEVTSSQAAVRNSLDQHEHERNLREELFHPCAKLPVAQIPIEMTGFHKARVNVTAP